MCCLQCSLVIQDFYQNTETVFIRLTSATFRKEMETCDGIAKQYEELCGENRWGKVAESLSDDFKVEEKQKLLSGILMVKRSLTTKYFNKGILNMDA